MFVLVIKMGDKFILATASTVMSVMVALMYIQPPKAMILKILWVVVVSLFNFYFLPYSVEKETENNLKLCYELDTQSIGLIKEKCRGIDLNKKQLWLL